MATVTTQLEPDESSVPAAEDGSGVARPAVPGDAALAERPPSRSAIVVTLAPESAWAGEAPVVMDRAEPGGLAANTARPEADPGTPDSQDLRSDVLVDGSPRRLRLEYRDTESALLVRGARGEHQAVRVRLLAERPAGPESPGSRRREILVDGWRVVVDVESAVRAELRAVAHRGRGTTGQSGPTLVRAMIPGVVLRVMANKGDTVEAGQVLIVVEAMKMQNEIRAPRSGAVDRVAVESGSKIEVGDLLVSLS
ncbi:MAG: biotin/lipoyl-containing protein [Chloroflexota bacterium]